MSSPVATQTILPDRFAAQVRTSLQRIGEQQLMERIWSKDASLWTSDDAAQRHIRNRLGWFAIASLMEPHIPHIESRAKEIRDAGFTHALLFGMGGSGLFPEVCRHTFGVAKGWLDLTLMDTTDPTAIAAARTRIPLERTLFIVSSKSGSTTESNSLCDYFYDEVRKVKGDRAGEQFVAITDAGTSLEAKAKELRFRDAFVHGPTSGQDVGGRFSGLTCFGLFPAALIGVNVREILARAKAVADACGPSTPVTENPAAQLGAFMADGVAAHRDKITLLSSSRLTRFGLWVEQLIAESIGKSGKGIIPIDGEPLRKPSAYPSDRLFVELQLKTELDQSLAKHADELAKLGHPVVRIYWNDAYDLGGDAMRWFLATAVTAALMNLNAFDEPNVQESKDRTKALLDRFAKEGRLPDAPPSLIDGPLGLYDAHAIDSAKSAAQAIQLFLRQAKPGDYLALTSFLPRTSTLDHAVEELFKRLSTNLPIATTLGFGPRYLHSTGQLHKGGSDQIMLLFLTSGDPVDVPVPGKPYSFSILKQAQALGDLQALQERKRRVLRVHLGPSPESAMPKLLEAVDNALAAA